MSPTAPPSRCPICKRLHPGTGRCPECERQHDRARGTRQDRGYDAEHDRLRADYQQRMSKGEQFACANLRCKTPDRPVDPARWDLGHTEDRTAWTGPEHPGCNRATTRTRVR